MTVRALCLALAPLLLPAAASAAEQPSLFDLLKQPAYRGAWDTMFQGKQPAPWIVTFGRTGNGVTSPSTPVTVEGEYDVLAWVCKPHDCGDNQLFVIFAPDARQAWALAAEGARQRWYGDPDEAVRDALGKAVLGQ